MINEVLANEPSSDTRGEFIELINASSTAIDLSGYQLGGNSGLRHKFTSLTLAPGQVVVVFGDKAAAPTNAGGVLLSSSTGALKLSNSQGTVTLVDKSGTVIDQVAYDRTLAAKDGVSMNRAQDGNSNAAWVSHDGIAGQSASPGKRADLAAF